MWLFSYYLNTLAVCSVIEINGDKKCQLMSNYANFVKSKKIKNIISYYLGELHKLNLFSNQTLKDNKKPPFRF